MNYRFNIDEWLARFPLEERHGRYHGEIITSPWHICQNENLRRELRHEYGWGPGVPVDIFIMADGEPPDRHVTKIGGLPYRPASADWPTLPKGAPMVFLAQLNFCDSKDLTGELPGDLLLVFADQVYTPEYLGFEWQPLGLNGLVEAHDIPESPIAVDPAVSLMQHQFLDQLKTQFDKLGLNLPKDVDRAYERTNAFAPCYGHIFRTASFPEAVARDNSMKYPLCRGKEVTSEYLLPQFQATQIGEAPFFIQQGDPDQIQGRLLCTLSSVQPAHDVDFPWLNQPSSIPLDKMSGEFDKYLMIGDMGCIYISIDESGEVYGHWSDY